MIEESVLKSFSGKNALVTGGTGLIGRQVVKLLCDAGAKVKIVSLDKVTVDARAEHVLGDLTEFAFCRDVTKGMDLVVHMAGIKGSMHVSKTMLGSHFVPTVMFNTNVLEAIRVNKVERAVYTSSIGAYADAAVFKEDDFSFASEPMDFAGWAKRVAELQVHAYKVQHGMENIAIVRPANVYGPGDNFDPKNAMVVPSLMCRVADGERPLSVWGDGSAVRDFAFSRDVAEGVLLALARGTRGAFVNLGSGQSVTIKELVETLARVTPFDFVFDASKPAGFPKRVMDISRAREWIGYEPSTSLYDGLKETWDWFQSNKDEYTKKKNYFV
jgi:GDP-L-fucose synthase